MSKMYKINNFILMVLIRPNSAIAAGGSHSLKERERPGEASLNLPSQRVVGPQRMRREVGLISHLYKIPSSSHLASICSLPVVEELAVF